MIMQATEDSLEKRVLSKREINEVVEGAFGKGFRADHRIYSYLSRYIMYRDGKANKIARKGFGIPLLIQAWHHAGILAEEDGSRIMVRPEYKGQAERYSEIYESHTGIKPEIRVVDWFNQSYRI